VEEAADIRNAPELLAPARFRHVSVPYFLRLIVQPHATTESACRSRT
jgi:hypothetical protein